MTADASRPLTRPGALAGPLVDGRPFGAGAAGRLRRRAQRMLVTGTEREEAELEQRLRALPALTRANTVALISPTGGVGKTTSAFVIATLLATHLKLRVVAVDANPQFGTLARLAPADRRAPGGLDDLLRDADRLYTAAELAEYVTRLASGMHILAAPRDPTVAAGLGPDAYGELVALLSCFYEVVLLDLGTGVVGPLARFAVERADQVVLVTTAEWVPSVVVLDALAHLGRHERTTVVINKAPPRLTETAAVEARLRAEGLSRAVTVPDDERFAAMLDSGTYSLDALRPQTRTAIKRLGVAVARQLV
jgi:MinD-like ATPase involved in chromosome partitioning or flagellar assembly